MPFLFFEDCGVADFEAGLFDNADDDDDDDPDDTTCSSDDPEDEARLLDDGEGDNEACLFL